MNPLPHRLRAAAGLLAAALLIGCATGPDPRPGLRRPYRNEHLDRIAVVPVYARSSFSLSGERLERRLDWTEGGVVAWLERHSSSIVAPEATRRRLDEQGAWHPFRPGGPLHDDLARSFEHAATSEKRRRQFRRLQKLHADRALPARYLLFGELLYHTVSRCVTRADSFNDRSTVVVRPGGNPNSEGPCVVTHFQARLVDAKTGRTVWFNRHLVEHHVDEIDRDVIRRNIADATARTLNYEDELASLLDAPTPES